MHTVPVGILIALPVILDELGFDGWGFMEDFALQPSSFVRPLSPVPVAFCGEVLAKAVAYSQCDELPLLMGARTKMASLGPLRLLISSSTSVREGLSFLMRFRRIWFPDFQFGLVEEQGVAEMRLDFTATFPGHQEIRTGFLAALVCHLELMLGRRLPILRLHLSRPEPDNVQSYRRHFGVTPRFGELRDAVFFAAALLEHKREPAQDMDCNLFLGAQLTSMEQALNVGFAERITELIETLLLTKSCSIERVTQILGISRPTLYRRLLEQDETFTGLLERSRQRLAESMLSRSNCSISEVADALGYSAASNFSRAFQRWTGVSPGVWRAR